MADADILIGPGRLYRAPLTTANPDESTVAFGASWGGSWTAMGDLLEGSGIVLGISEDFTKVYTELSTAPKNAVRTRREVMIKGTLAEHSVANMAIALQGTAQTTAAAGGGQKGYSDIPIGTETDVSFYKWGFEAFRKDASDTKQPVRYFLHKGFFRIAGDVNFAKQNPTGIPFEICILGDGSQSVGAELGLLQQVTAAATAT